MRIGLYGGTFDPIHNGHLIIARDIFEQKKLDKIILIPSYLTPLKENISSHIHRLAMLKLACGESCFEISDYEIRSKQRKFTYQTLDYFSAEFKNDDLYFIMGYDSFLNIKKWKNWNYLISNYKIIVAGRNTEVKVNPADNLDKIANMVSFVNTRTIDISSSEIRSRVKERKPISYFLPKNVENYIRVNNLYGV